MKFQEKRKDPNYTILTGKDVTPQATPFFRDFQRKKREGPEKASKRYATKMCENIAEIERGKRVHGGHRGIRGRRLEKNLAEEK